MKIVGGIVNPKKLFRNTSLGRTIANNKGGLFDDTLGEIRKDLTQLSYPNLRNEENERLVEFLSITRHSRKAILATCASRC